MYKAVSRLASAEQRGRAVNPLGEAVERRRTETFGIHLDGRWAAEHGSQKAAKPLTTGFVQQTKHLLEKVVLYFPPTNMCPLSLYKTNNPLTVVPWVH